MPNSLTLKPGMSLGNGRYVLDRLLKQGRSSLTLQGTQVSNGRSLLFKFPLQDQGLLTAHQQRFQHIWQRVGHFQHPYVQQTVDYLEEQGIPCLVLEPIGGKSLAHLVTQPLPEATALRLLFQMAQGVQQLHDRGVIHGDLKPQNLIQHPQSKTIVVVDWGLYWQGWNSQLSPYSAPEPFTPQELRVNLDVYSLAACLYTLVTGHPPIAAAQQGTTPLVPPQQLIPSLSPMTQDAILQGMNLNPDRRPKSVQAWLTLLPQPYAPAAQLPNLQAPVPSGSASPQAANPVNGNAPQPNSQAIPQPPVKTVQTQVAPGSSNSRSAPSRSVTPGALRPLLTGLWVMTIAGVFGFALGGLLRWQQTQNAFAPPFLEKSQSFPSKTWPGTLDLAFPDDAPLPETDYASDSYEPYLDWSPTVPQEEAIYPTDSTDSLDSTDSPDLFAPDPSLAVPEEGSTEEGNIDPSEPIADPSEPLGNSPALEDSFEDPLYIPSEEPAPAEEPPVVAPADSSAAHHRQRSP